MQAAFAQAPAPRGAHVPAGEDEPIASYASEIMGGDSGPDDEARLIRIASQQTCPMHGTSIDTRACTSSLSRCGSFEGDPIVNVPLAATTISRPIGQSLRRTSFPYASTPGATAVGPAVVLTLVKPHMGWRVMRIPATDERPVALSTRS